MPNPTLNRAATLRLPLLVVVNLAVFLSGLMGLGVLWHFKQTPTRVGGKAFEAPLFPNSIAWRANKRTLVVFTKHGCPYCMRSRPFYERLTAAIEASRSSSEVVYATPDSLGLTAIDVPYTGRRVETRSNVPIFQYVEGTPTILSVGNNGKVRKVWVGLLDAKGEKEVLDEVK